MVKKVVIIGGGLALVGLLLFGRSAVSYVRTSAGYVSDSVRDSVPISFEIERARGMIRDLAPEVRKNMHLIAKEQVAIKRLQEQIAESESRQKTQKEQMTRLQSDLQSGNNAFQYAGRSYSAKRVKDDLANRLKRFKTNDARLVSLQKTCNARQRTLDATREKLEATLVAKRNLETEVEQLEARMHMIAAAKATSEFQFDESRLGRVRELVQNLQTRLDVDEQLVDAQSQYHDEIPLDEPTPDDIVDQVTEYFGAETPDAAAIALD